MRLQFGEEAEALRTEVRGFFARDYPQDVLERVRRGDVVSREDQIRSQRALRGRGWLAPAWPAEHGGPGWSPVQRYVFEEELERAGAPSIIPMGIIYVGPVIYTFGTQEQRARWLPDILDSRAIWAQGYSEPEAGSDLAGLAMAAERDGDHYLLNGSKIWTTQAHWADWIFCLVRTSREARRQDGITFLCLRMDSPGVTVHPIVTLDGVHHLNRVDFRDVRVPIANRIGEEGRGWHYATVLLRNERISYAHVARKRADVERLPALAARLPGEDGTSMADDPRFRSDVAALGARVDVLEVSTLRVLAAGEEAAPAQASALKILATETAQLIAKIYVDLAGRSAGIGGDRTRDGWWRQAPLAPAFAIPWTAAYLFERAGGIYGGATEIQKNIIWRTL